MRTRFKSGEWGYVPASIRDWKAVLSVDAALRRKVDQKTRKLLPLTDEVLRQHLEGKLSLPKIRSGLKRQGLGPFVRSSSFPQ